MSSDTTLYNSLSILHTKSKFTSGFPPFLLNGSIIPSAVPRRNRFAYAVSQLFRQNGSHPNKKSHRLNPPEETLPSELSIREAPV